MEDSPTVHLPIRTGEHGIARPAVLSWSALIAAAGTLIAWGSLQQRVETLERVQSRMDDRVVTRQEWSGQQAVIDSRLERIEQSVQQLLDLQLRRGRP